MKISTVSRDDQRPPMKRFRPCEIIEKEINPVDMNHVCVPKVSNHGRCQWISLRSYKRDSHYLDAEHDFTSLQYIACRRVEDVIERDNFGSVAVRDLPSGKFQNDRLETTDGRIKLPDNVNDAHCGLRDGGTF